MTLKVCWTSVDIRASCRNNCATYPMQVERMRARRSDCTARQADLDNFVRRKAVITTLREEFLCLLRTAENLEQDGNARRHERSVVDSKSTACLKVFRQYQGVLEMAMNIRGPAQG